MTLEQHRQFGNDLKRVRDALLQPHIICLKSKEARAVTSALRYVDRLRNKMDSAACRDFPRVPDVTQLYYGEIQ
jgi:hypothetical protein